MVSIGKTQFVSLY